MNLLEQLRRDEGCIHHAYQDTLGKWTIGVGRLIDKNGGGLSDQEIDMLLDNDIEAKTNEVKRFCPWLARLNEPRQATVIAMAFQVGLKGLQGFRKALQAIEDGQYAEAAEHMLDSRWAKQTPARAARHAQQMLTGEWV